jgi:hypothetical protein
MRLRTLSLLCVLALCLSACAAPSDPVAVVQAFVRAVDGENVDAGLKLLADEVVLGYGNDETTIRPGAVRGQAEKLFKEQNFSLQASNFQLDGSQVYFSVKVSDDKEQRSGNCTCRATVEEGKIKRLVVLFCNEG